MSNTATTTTTKVKWAIDPAHSELSFKVRHMMIANVKGEFRKFHGEVDAEDFTKASITVAIETASVFTNDEERDKHLKSPDFFDAEKHKEIVFKSRAFKKVNGDNYKLEGDLTIRGTTNPITLDVEFGGIGKDPWGNEKVAFAISGKINRSLWKLNWNVALEAGGVLVSEEVRIQADVQLIKQVDK